MRDETLNILNRKFTNVREREGRGGRMLSYVAGHDVVHRLNEAFDGDWSFQVKHQQVLNDQVVVLGRLTAADSVKEQFGGSDIMYFKGTQNAVSISDDFKAATTDALKKCASLMGVALHLYDDREDAPAQSTSRQSHRPTARSGGTTPSSPGGAAGGSFVFPWGKHKGTPLTEVPESYLLWIDNADDFKDKTIQGLVRQELQRRAEIAVPADDPRPRPPDDDDIPF